MNHTKGQFLNDGRQALPEGSVIELENQSFKINGLIGCGGGSLIYSVTACAPPNATFALKEVFLRGCTRSETWQIYPTSPWTSCELDDYKSIFKEREKLGTLAQEKNYQARGQIQWYEDAVIRTRPNNQDNRVHNLYALSESLNQKGCSLRQYIQQSWPFTLKHALVVMESVCAGFAQLHVNGIVHGDISASNIFWLHHSGDSYRGEATVIDFGQARPVTVDIKDGVKKTDSIPATAFIPTTEGFTPPEVLGRHESIRLTPAADVFGLTVLFYMFLDDRLRYPPRGPYEICTMPEDLQRLDCNEIMIDEINAILRRGTSLNPEERFQDAGEMLKALEELADCLYLRCDQNGNVTPSTLRHGAMTYLEQHESFFRTEHDPKLAPELKEMGLTKLTVYGQEKDGTQQPVQTLLEKSRGKDIYIESPGGAGKTFALAQLFKDKLYGPDVVPLYLDMQGFNEKALKASGNYELVIPWLLAHQYMASNYAEKSVEGIKRLLYKTDQILLILDNLHKVPEKLHDLAINAVNTLHNQALWLIVAGRKVDSLLKITLLDERNDPLELAIENKIYLHTIPESDARERICKAGLQLNPMEQIAFKRQYDIIGLPLFFMRWLELIVARVNPTDSFASTSIILYAYFSCRLEAHVPSATDSSASGFALYRLIEEVAPRIAFWYGQSTECAHTKEKIANELGHKTAESLPSIIALGIMAESDGQYYFEHDVYESFFCGLYISKHLRQAIEYDDTNALNKINYGWPTSSAYYWMHQGRINWHHGHDLNELSMEYSLEEYFQILYNYFCATEQFDVIISNIALETPFYEGFVNGRACFSSQWLQLVEKGKDAEGKWIIGSLYHLGKGVPKDAEKAVFWFQKAAEDGHVRSQYNLACAYAKGDGIPQDYEKAAFWYQLAANRGYAEAQYNLAYMYLKGLGLAQNDEKAFYWYKQSADQGFAAAKASLGLAYESGVGVLQNFREAVICYKQAADLGSIVAKNNLGNMYTKGRGVEQNYEMAALWYRMAADQGNIEAQINLGVAYVQGQGVPQDPELAIHYLQQAAKRRSSDAQYNLGVIYLKGILVKQDYKKAIHWFEQAAVQQHPNAQYLLGRMYLLGQGVTQDYKTAYNWLENAARQGHHDAPYQLGLMYEKGLGIPQDYSTAIIWHKKAAAQENSEAQLRVGLFYYHGECVNQSVQQAIFWFNKAANNDNAQAQYMLGLIYSNGKGVPKDYERAIYWLSRAAKQNFAMALKALGDAYVQGRGVKKNLVTAVRLYEKAAQLGDADAQVCLAAAYSVGNGIQKDSEKMIFWLQRAESQGNLEALYRMGNAYYFGNGVEKNYVAAVDYYKKAAQKGHMLAMKNLAILYYRGEGVERDYQKYLYWIKAFKKNRRKHFGNLFFDV